MPKKSAEPSQADLNAAAGGVASVDRALSLLGTFTGATPVLTLTAIAIRVGLHKSTVLRLLASLEHAGLVCRQPDGAWGLGGEVARLHQVWAASFSLPSVYRIIVSMKMVAP